jgi:hypothetical protein
MSSFRSPDLLERRNNAATVKKVMLEKFRAARQPAFEQQRLKRIAVNEARAFRAAERESAKKVREAELAAQATRVPPNSPRRRTAKPRKQRRSLRLKRPSAMRRWQRNKKPGAMPAMQHARPQKKSGGGGPNPQYPISALGHERTIKS